MQLTYYCRLYEASPYNMQIDRATFIALSLVKPKGLRKGLQLVRGTIIFYVDVCRGSRTCGIPVPSVFLTGTGIPLKFST
jgi:hypothetical protein